MMTFDPNRAAHIEVSNDTSPVLVMLAFAGVLLLILTLSLPAAAENSNCDRYQFLCEGGAVAAVGVRSARPGLEIPAGIAAMVDSAAFAAGVPAHIAHAVVRSESRYRANARSHAGALGLTQIRCPTARGIGFAGSCRDLFDPATNLIWGFKFLRLALDKGGENCSGASLYNTGIYTRARCTAYGRMVMKRAMQ